MTPIALPKFLKLRKSGASHRRMMNHPAATPNAMNRVEGQSALADLLYRRGNSFPRLIENKVTVTLPASFSAKIFLQVTVTCDSSATYELGKQIHRNANGFLRRCLARQNFVKRFR